MPRGSSPNSKDNLTEGTKAAKKRGGGGLERNPNAAANLKRGGIAEHVAAANARADAVAEQGKTDLLGALEANLAIGLKVLNRELTKLAGGKPLEPALTTFMDKIRLMINDAQAYRDRLSTDEPAMLVALEMVKAFESRNTSPLSPAGPPVTDDPPPTDDDTASD